MRIAFVAVTAALFAQTGVSVGQGKKTDLDLMQGTWNFVSMKNSDGNDPPADVLKKWSVVIKGDSFKVMEKDDILASQKIKLDAGKKPKQIDLTHEEGPDKGKSEPGIYKIDGDTLTLAMNDPGKDRPAAFETKKDTKISVVVLKKAK
jgi:uncharacterized protein (TIGR03067 family)